MFFLQETHSTPDDEDEWQQEWGGRLIFSHGTSNSKGVLTGFTKNLDFNIEKTTRDKSGRVLLTDVTLNSHKTILINFYNANTDEERIRSTDSLVSHLSNHGIEPNTKPFYREI